jgi:hypothetical protein
MYQLVRTLDDGTFCVVTHDKDEAKLQRVAEAINLSLSVLHYFAKYGYAPAAASYCVRPAHHPLHDNSGNAETVRTIHQA